MEKAYDIITDRILAELDKGSVPWRKPWTVPTGMMPQNAVSKRPYTSINSLMLGLAPFPDPRWVTFHGALDLGGSVRKGEKGFPVVFWKWLSVEGEDKDGNKKPKEIPFLRYYTVFNVLQCDGLKLPPLADVLGEPPQPNDAAERIIATMPDKPSIANDGGVNAFYRPSTDSVHLPKREAFTDAGEYYSVAFHELTHSTGHPKRLARLEDLTQLAAFGSADYSKEELVAEFGASYLCHASGIENTIPNSAAYIASWAKRIKDDHKLIVLAASKAQKAVDYITGRKLQEQATAK